MGRFARTAAVVTIVVSLPACLGREVPVPEALPAGTPAVTACGGPPGSVPLLDPDGSGCVPISRLSMWTCEGTGAAPFARHTVDGRPHRYLGGRFAVPVPEPPASADLIGATGDVEVFADPRDTRWLWVRRDGATARWLALPDRAPDDPPDAFFIGDSITDGASAFFPAALPGWVTGFDAVPGRGSVSGVTPAAEQAAARPRRRGRRARDERPGPRGLQGERGGDPGLARRRPARAVADREGTARDRDAAGCEPRDPRPRPHLPERLARGLGRPSEG